MSGINWIELLVAGLFSAVSAMAGALVVNQGWIDEGCRAIFTEGRDMLFHDFSDAPAICRKMLEDEPERARMAANAGQLVASGHTYRHRMKTILDTMKGGVTEERMKNRARFTIHVAEALTCAHRDFGWKGRAAAALKTAFGKSAAGTMIYLLRYARYRLREKLEKIIWSFGKAPV